MLYPANIGYVEAISERRVQPSFPVPTCATAAAAHGETCSCFPFPFPFPFGCVDRAVPLLRYVCTTALAPPSVVCSLQVQRLVMAPIRSNVPTQIVSAAFVHAHPFSVPYLSKLNPSLSLSLSLILALGRSCACALFCFVRALCVHQVRQRHRRGTVVTPYHIREASDYFGLDEKDVRECVQELGGTIWEEDDDQVKGRPLIRWPWLSVTTLRFSVLKVEVAMQWCFFGIANLRESGRPRQ